MALFKMHQISLAAKHSVGVNYGDKLSKSTEEQAFARAQYFYAFAKAVHSSPSLMRALTDLGKSYEQKHKLISTLSSSIKADELVTDVIVDLSSKNWSQSYDFYASICEFGINSAIISLSKRGKDANESLKMAEDELFYMIRALKDQSTIYNDLNLLRDYLSSENKPLDARLKIVDDLFAGKIDEVSLLLAKFAVLAIHGAGRYVNALQELSNDVANMRGYKVAHICAAVKPTAPQLKRLEALLEKEYEQKMQLNIVIDPNILGGIRVRVDDAMFDHSILNKLNHFQNSVNSTLGN